MSGCTRMNGCMDGRNRERGGDGRMDRGKHGRAREGGRERRKEGSHLESGPAGSLDRVLGLGDAEEREGRGQREESCEVETHGDNEGGLRGLVVRSGACVARAEVAKSER